MHMHVYIFFVLLPLFVFIETWLSCFFLNIYKYLTVTKSLTSNARVVQFSILFKTNSENLIHNHKCSPKNIPLYWSNVGQVMVHYILFSPLCIQFNTKKKIFTKEKITLKPKYSIIIDLKTILIQIDSRLEWNHFQCTKLFFPLCTSINKIVYVGVK